MNVLINTSIAKEGAMKTFFIGRGGENIVTKGEEKAEVLSTFASVFDNKTNHPQDSWPPELVDGVREQNSPPVIQEEVVSDFFSHFEVRGLWDHDWKLAHVTPIHQRARRI